MNLLTKFNLIESVFLNFIFEFLCYLFFSGGAYLLLKRVLITKLKIKQFGKDQLKKENIKREFLHSIKTVLVFIVPTLIVLLPQTSRFLKTYTEVEEYGHLWLFLSIPISLILHDTYFYWAHRILHSKKLYRHFHHIHHKSIYPTPLCAYSFNFMEALVHGMAFVIFALFIPLHIYVIMGLTVVSLVFNSYGHLGVNLLSTKTQESFPFKYFNHPTHHGRHHRYNRGNFGLYFRFWDKVMGTWVGAMPE